MAFSRLTVFKALTLRPQHSHALQNYFCRCILVFNSCKAGGPCVVFMAQKLSLNCSLFQLPIHVTKSQARLLNAS